MSDISDLSASMLAYSLVRTTGQADLKLKPDFGSILPSDIRTAAEGLRKSGLINVTAGDLTDPFGWEITGNGLEVIAEQALIRPEKLKTDWFIGFGNKKQTININITSAIGRGARAESSSVSNEIIVELALKQMIDSIDASNAPADEKEKAKSKLREFLEHPVVAAVLGAAAEAGLKLLVHGG